MGAIARMKSKSGGSQAPVILSPVTAVDLSLLDRSDVFTLLNTGAVTIPTIGATMPVHPGRQIVLMNSASSSNDFTLTNNADTTTKGEMDLGGGDVTLGTEDVLTLTQQANGTWWETSLANN